MFINADNALRGVWKVSMVICVCFGASSASEMRVEPHALLVHAPLWYVSGWDRGKDAPRLFRMDRIRRAVVQRDAEFSARPNALYWV
jgi:predicted DNA-binding transcriptional regulator YafY